MANPAQLPLYDRLALLALILVVYFVLIGIYRRRENLIHSLRNLFYGLALGWVVFIITAAMHWRETHALVIGIGVGIAYFFGFARKRSRHIPESVKRRVIARWEAETGKKFDSRKYEVDHEIPFSQGGSNTEDNLQVIEKKRNRSKGAKSPRWDLLGRR